MCSIFWITTDHSVTTYIFADVIKKNLNLSTDTHRAEQGRHRETRRADARTKRADLEHLTADELCAAAGHVHGVAVVYAIRGGRARASAASPGERAPERLAASY